MEEIRQLIATVGIPVNITNPFEFETKGEMMATSPNAALLTTHASHTVSCGKWKRKRVQCGRCLPCLIRRSAFHHAGLQDNTIYRFTNLTVVKNDPKEHDDLLALRLAVGKLATANLDSWVTTGGPLPEDPVLRSKYVSVFRRGMDEIQSFPIAQNCYP